MSLTYTVCTKIKVKETFLNYLLQSRNSSPCRTACLWRRRPGPGGRHPREGLDLPRLHRRLLPRQPRHHPPQRRGSPRRRRRERHHHRRLRHVRGHPAPCAIPRRPQARRPPPTTRRSSGAAHRRLQRRRLHLRRRLYQSDQDHPHSRPL